VNVKIAQKVHKQRY